MNKEWMDQGICATSPEANKLFMSPYLEPFDEQAFYDDHIGLQKLTKKEELEVKKTLQGELESSRTEHDLGHRMYTKVAKNMCVSCPVREACQDYAFAQEMDGTPMYGVVAGYTQEERSSMILQNAS